MHTIPGTKVGELQLTTPLGAGGMGQVWRATNSAGEVFAVKVLGELCVDDPASRARFEREGDVVLAVDHPHIVRGIDRGMDESGNPFLVLEQVPGLRLDHFLEKHGPLSIDEAESLVLQIADALEHIHARGVTHRDLKPANILVERTRGELHATLIDFGIASASWADSITEARQTLGTLKYMSPEQTFGVNAPSHFADLWGLTVVAYECLAGRVPFDGESLGQICVAIYDGDFLPVTLFNGGFTPVADAFFSRALARDRQHRFQSLGEWRAAFREVTAGSDRCRRASGANRSALDAARPTTVAEACGRDSEPVTRALRPTRSNRTGVAYAWLAAMAGMLVPANACLRAFTQIF
ncbi:MAG: serine/threonine-protein kinase [Polyangiales bacterium]|nr:serine/threonine protein kinase [Myxococcales bacterium]